MSLQRPDESAFDAVLAAQHLQAYVAANPSFCAEWDQVAELGGTRGMFHVIENGSCWVRADCLDQSVELKVGDLVMFPRGDDHRLCSAPHGIDTPAGEQFSTLLCVVFEFATGMNNPVVAALPNCVILRAVDSDGQVRSLCSLILQEFRRGALGARAVMDRLCEAIFVLVVRNHVQNTSSPRGMLGAVSDLRLARALEVIHRRPADRWTVAALAERAHMSRTAFAARFQAVLGVGPIRYLTEWRMLAALNHLRNPYTSVSSVAEQLGYQTDAAFRRSFKRIHGFGPGQIRRAAVGRSDPTNRKPGSSPGPHAGRAEAPGRANAD